MRAFITPMIRYALLAPLFFVSSVYPADAVTPGERHGLSEPGPASTLRLPAMDLDQLLEKDLQSAKDGYPLHYAEPLPLTDILLAHGAPSVGEWIQTDSDTWLWRYAVHAKGATSLDFGFHNVWLPNGAALYVYDDQRLLVRGPYTDQDNKSHRELWTPVVPGDRAIIELEVPASLKEYVSLELVQVNYGYRFFNEHLASKALECNIDAVCPQGDPFRDQIRSVAAFGQSSTAAFCTGQMINNTSNDNTPYFLTANHCTITPQNAASVVIFWNYQSDTCRSGPDSGQVLNLQGFADTSTGTTHIASRSASDFTLLLLDQDPPDSYNVFWAGWDRRDIAPTSGVIFPHPQGHEKRLAIDSGPITEGSGTQNFGTFSLQPGTYWQVSAWDEGLVEQGGSGGALFNQDKRIVGQESGGVLPSCPANNEGPDFFGRFSVSWDAGGTPTSRLQDHLDSIDTGQTTLDGIEACDRPTVAITSDQNPARVGGTVLFSSQITGGLAPYVLEWDLDGDGGTDSTDTSVSASFPDALSSNISLTVTDSVDCAATATFGQVIEAPRIVVDSTGAPIEQCGDGDANIEPGETWAFPVTLSNQGNADMSGGIAAFAPASAIDNSAPGDFGYTLADSSTAACPFNFRDISGSGTPVTLSAIDDGGGSVPLGGPGFDIYGTRFNELGISTNGYLSTDSSEAGQDFDNDCPLPAAPSSGTGARLAVLHDDFLGGQVRRQYFANCPRPGDVPGAAGCNVIQWSNMDYFEGGANATFQALLYDNSNQIVYQYLSGNPKMGNSQTVGIQNDGASDGLTFACNQPGSITDNSAVCIFHPVSAAISEGIEIDSPAIAIGSLSVGNSTTVNVVVQIDSSFPCDGIFGLDYLGTAHDDGFSNSGDKSVVTATTTECNSTASCSVDKSHLVLNQGVWFNPVRSGTGLDFHFVGDQMYATWFTAEAGRVPVWYYVQTLNGQARVGEQIRTSLLRFTNNGNSTNLDVSFDTIGEAVFSFLNESTAVMTWVINGQVNGEKLLHLALDTPPVDDVLTDQWFSQAEAGWGLGVHVQGSQEFDTLYLYGTDGEPRWVVTVGNPLTAGNSDISAFESHCPGCAYLTPLQLPAGSFSRIINTDGTGTLDLNISVGGDQPIEWLRDDLSIMQISPPAKFRQP